MVFLYSPFLLLGLVAISFFRFFGLRTLKENEHIPSSESSDVLLKAFWKLLFFFYLHDFCMGSGTGHQHHVKLIIYPGDVITKYGFTRGMFKTWYMHDGASDWVLEGLVRIHTLQRRQELPWKTLIFRSRLASYHTHDSGLRNEIVTIGQQILEWLRWWAWQFSDVTGLGNGRVMWQYLRQGQLF